MSYLVCGVNASIDDIRTSAFAGTFIVDVRRAARLRARQARKTPVCALLCGFHCNDSILLKILDLSQDQHLGVYSLGVRVAYVGIIL